MNNPQPHDEATQDMNRAAHARLARLTLHEGRYHQIKRMFHRIGNRVEKLHRESIGAIALPPDLGPGEWRRLTEEEIGGVADTPPST